MVAPSDVQTCHFFKLSTENYVKIWHQCDIMAIAVLNRQFARFMVGKFHISLYAAAARETDVEMSNLYSCPSEDAQEGGEVTDIRGLWLVGGGEGSRDPFGNSSACCPFLLPHCCHLPLPLGPFLVAYNFNTTVMKLYWSPVCFTVGPQEAYNVDLF